MGLLLPLSCCCGCCCLLALYLVGCCWLWRFAVTCVWVIACGAGLTPRLCLFTYAF